MLCSGAASPPCQIYHPQERLKNFLRKKYAWVLKCRAIVLGCHSLVVLFTYPLFHLVLSSPVPTSIPSPLWRVLIPLLSMDHLLLNPLHLWSLFPLLKPTLCIYPHGNSTNNFVPYNESLFIEFILCASWNSLLHAPRT